LDNHFILPDSHLSSDYAPLSIDISIFEEIINMSKLTITPKSEQETKFIKDIISNFKMLDTLNIEDIVKLKQVVNQLGLIIDLNCGRKMQKNRKYLNIPSSGGWIRAVELSTLTGHQEVMKTGNHSKRQLRTPSEFSSMTRFKKLQIKVEALRN